MAAHQISTKFTGFSSGLVRELALFGASGLSLLAAAIHLWAVPGHLSEWWGYGAFFVALALLQGLFAVALLRRPSRGLLLSGALANLGVVALYITTRTAGIPFVGPHAGEVHAAGALDLTVTAAELALAAALTALAGEGRRARLYVVIGAVQALGTGLVLHALHSEMHAEQGLGFVTHWLQNAVLALPLSVLALVVAAPLARAGAGFFFGENAFAARISWALAAAGAYAAAGIPANALAAHHVSAGAFLAQAGRDAGVVLGAGFVILLAVARLRGAPWEAPRAVSFWRPRAATALVGLAAGLFVLVGPGAFEMLSSPVQAQAAPGACSAASADRSYDVAAINVDIPFNRWGSVDPDGQIFVLQGDKAAVKNWSKPLAANPAEDPAGNRRLRPRPLVIRANVGECVKVELTNEMNQQQWGGRLADPRVSMQVRGVAYDAQTSDGGAVGYNEDTTVGIGETKTYYWRMPSEEGLHLFRSQTMTSGEEEDAGSNAHGLYGAVAVEPAGSTWHDPVTGRELYTQTGNQSGELYVDADIRMPGPGNNDFRETVQLAQDYSEVAPGEVGHGFNYGTEPQRYREAPKNLPADGIGEEVSLSSWAYGDPAVVKLASGPGPWEPLRDAQGKLVTDPAKVEDCNPNDYPGFDSTSCYTSNVTHSYQGDPTKIRYAMAGVAETHVFHMHAHQWLADPAKTADFYADPKNPKSATLDSQTFGPGEAFTADLLYGAGSKPGTVGDSIFHCHLYPHFAEGFWSLFRVHDVREDGTNDLPDGTNVRNLQPLPDRAAQAPPAADLNIDGEGTDNPGFPRFVPGEFGWRAPQAPGSILEPDPTTADPDDKREATRIVAGKPLDAARLSAADPLENSLMEKLKAEAGAQRMLNEGSAPKPGAPFTDPCKPEPGQPNPREVTYNVSVMQRDVVYNEAGWHDTQGRFLVLDKDMQKMLEKNPDGTYKHQPEPLFARVNAGDCVNFNLTNLLPNWFGNDAFVKLIQTNMMGQHIHLVKFDVLASDGSTNGWNYQQAAFTEEQMNFNNRLLDDDPTNDPACNKTAGCRLPSPANWNPSWGKGMEPGQTIRERWYADYELRTVFSHDHHFAAVDQNRGQFAGLLVEPEKMNFRNPKTGQFYQPGNGNVPGAPNCGASCEGNAVGSAMDIIGPGASDDFREFGLAFQDFVSLTRKGGDPQNRDDVLVGPNAPEHYPDEDPGIVGVNYRNAPLPLRQERNGQPTDPAHAFSSIVHGDPATPTMQAYAEDPIQVRLMQGSQEHQHVFDMHGMRWREDPNNPNSSLVNTQDVGISEAFNFKVPKISCAADERSCAGDYMYSSTNIDDLYMGMWGILRARAERVSSLLPLPDNDPGAQDATPTPAESVAPASPTSLAPPEAASPGNPCPTGAPVKKYNVVAMEQRLEYNKEGDHDPFGLIYALAEDEAAIRAGDKKPEPLTLRANEGDCIEVRLANNLTQGWLQRHGNAGTNGDAMQPLEPLSGTRAGLRVSLHPQIVKYDVRGSDGTAVGYNRDQTVAPGDSRLYRWYADDPGAGEIGSTNLTDFGDARGHRHHGLFAGLNIEPKGSTYHDPMTGEQIRSGASADIRIPGPDNDFREFSLFFQDGLNMRDAAGGAVDLPEPPADPNAPPEPPEPAGEAHDHIDQGEKGFNYGSAPFRHRLGQEAITATPTNPLDGWKTANVYNSAMHGDPSTPIFRAFAGDRVRMRVLQGADKQRQHTFEQLGHAWRQFPDDPGSPLISAQGGFSVGRTLNVHLPSAGNGFAGDYRYADGMYRHNLSGGLWGLMRVYDRPSDAQAMNPTPLGNVDNPHAGGHPILPLEAQNVATGMTLGAAPTSVQPGGATVLSGRLSATGGPLARRAVTLEQRPAGSTAAFAAVPDGRATTDDQGAFRFPNVSPQGTTEYRAVFAGSSGAGLEGSVSAGVRVVVMGETALQATASPAVVFGQATNVTGSLTEDAKPLPGKQVTLEQRPAGQTAFSKVGAPANTDANGRFVFSGVKPTKNTEYRVVFAGEPSAGLKPSQAVTPVKVRASVSLAAAGANLKLGGSRAISGSVAPAHKGVVKLVVKRNGSPVLSKALSLGATSRFAYTYKPTVPGAYTVQATFAGDADHLANSSATRSFRAVR